MSNEKNIDMTPQEVIENLYTLHGVELTLTPEIESLINYVSHVQFNKGWYDACQKYMTFINQNTIWNRAKNWLRMIF